MISLKLLIRNFRGGELKLLSVALVLAVAVLSAIAIFTDRLETTLLNQSNTLLGADKIINSSRVINKDWISTAEKNGLSVSSSIEFSSMVYAGEEMHLANVEAVENNFPLRGNLEISKVPFARNSADIVSVNQAPAPGEVWIDTRLLSQLNTELGKKIAIGEQEFLVSYVLIREPESGGIMANFSPRVLMNRVDLAATEVTLVGSRLKYSMQLASDNEKSLDRFMAWIKPQLTKHERIEDLQSNQERVAKTLASGKQFLLFSAVIAVLLSGVAVAIAARQFSDRHINQVALMKSFGTSTTRIRVLYFSQLLFLGGLASLIGLLIGHLIQMQVAAMLESAYQMHLLPPKLLPYALSFFSGLVCLSCFALPALWFLPAIPPLKILRRELAIADVQIGFQISFALAAVIFLVGLFSRDLKMTLSVTVALGVILLVASILSFAFFSSIRLFLHRLGGFWRLAFSNLQRRKSQSLVQLVVFSIAIMLLVTLTIVRTSLIDDWRSQFPQNAPNHFIVNIAPSEVDDVRAILAEQKVLDAPLYPMIRGRIQKINGVEPSDELAKNVNALTREVNLTQSTKMGKDNKIIEGEWWDQRQNSELPGVSVEQQTAKDLHLKIGDKIEFSLGGLILDAQVASIRSVDWKSMQPNFFFIFEQGALDNYSPTFMTSIYLPSTKKLLINQLLRKYPTLLVLELDRVIEQLRSIIDQVSEAIGLVLWLTLAAGSLVLFAAVMSSIDSRRQESGLLRALGSSRQLILGSVMVEFFVMGLLAGIVATIGAEALLLSMQKFVFHNQIQPHYVFWILSPLLSAIFIASLGVFCCRSVLTTPPMVVLREA